MEQYKYLLILTLFFVACTETSEDQNNPNDAGLIAADTVNNQEASVPNELPDLNEGEIREDDFFALFKYDFSQEYDFGWRFIESNYDEYPEDTLREHTPYDNDTDLSEYNIIKANGGETDESDVEINFVGAAHSFKYINGNRLLVTHIQGEINSTFYYYYINSDFEILDEGYLADSGGDEGYWDYSYGEFSKDYSVYQIKEVSGFGLDTTDISSDVFYFN